MQASINSTRPDARPIQMPRLSYRNSTIVDPAQLESYRSNPSAPEPIPTDVSSLPTDKKPSTVTVAQIRQRVSISSPRTQSSAIFSSPPLPQKKKASFLGGLFVKEASSAALEQVAAQLIAQHGGLNPKAVPGVSSAKMPEFVPKVNSKWDGVPATVKASVKDKRENERSRVPSRLSFAPSARPQSSERRPQRTPSLDRHSSNSTLSSFDSRGAGAYTHGNPSRSFRRGSGSGYSPSEYGPQHESRNSSEFPLSPYLAFDSTIPSLPTEGLGLYQTISNDRSDRSRSCSSDRRVAGIGLGLSRPLDVEEPSIDAVPEYSSTPATTPRDHSPATPSILPAGLPILPLVESKLIRNDQDVIRLSRGPDVLGPPVATKTKVEVRTNGFLAGEARPLELPDENADYRERASTSPRNHPKGKLKKSSESQSRLQKGSKPRSVIRTR